MTKTKLKSSTQHADNYSLQPRAKTMLIVRETTFFSHQTRLKTILLVSLRKTTTTLLASHTICTSSRRRRKLAYHSSQMILTNQDWCRRQVSKSRPASPSSIMLQTNQLSKCLKAPILNLASYNRPNRALKNGRTQRKTH